MTEALTPRQVAEQLIDVANRVNRDAGTLYAWATRLMLRPDDERYRRKLLGYMQRYCKEHVQSRADEVEDIRDGLYAATPRPKSDRRCKRPPSRSAPAGENVIALFGREP